MGGGYWRSFKQGGRGECADITNNEHVLNVKLQNACSHMYSEVVSPYNCAHSSEEVKVVHALRQEVRRQAMTVVCAHTYVASMGSTVTGRIKLDDGNAVWSELLPCGSLFLAPRKVLSHPRFPTSWWNL